MKKIIYPQYYLLLSMLLLSGCDTPKPQFAPSNKTVSEYHDKQYNTPARNNTPKSQFNPSNKEIIFENYKTYVVPKGSTYASITEDYLRKIKNLRNLPRKNMDCTKTDGVEKAKCGADIAFIRCRQDPIIWIETSIAEKYKSDPFKSFLYEMEAFTVGRAGCTKPLTEKEYYITYHHDLNQKNPKLAKQIVLQFQEDQKLNKSNLEYIENIKRLKNEDTINKIKFGF